MSAAPRLAAIVLAAGASTRFGGVKLAARLHGRPLLAHALAAIPPMRRIVVLGHHAGIVAPLLPDGAEIVHNPDPAAGMGSSIACGARHLGAEDAVFVVLGDMPHLAPADYHALAAAWRGAGDICVPVHGGRRGHPVLFGAAHFSQLALLAGDRGARRIFAAPQARISEVASSAGALRDYDTPNDLDTAQNAAATLRN